MSNGRSTTQRGYGATHQALRKQWAPRVKTGAVKCNRCGERIRPGEPWDLDHTDDRTAYAGPAHRRCNRATAGRKGADVTNAKRSMVIRDW